MVGRAQLGGRRARGGGGCCSCCWAAAGCSSEQLLGDCCAAARRLPGDCWRLAPSAWHPQPQKPRIRAAGMFAPAASRARQRLPTCCQAVQPPHWVFQVLCAKHADRSHDDGTRVLEQCTRQQATCTPDVPSCCITRGAHGAQLPQARAAPRAPGAAAPPGAVGTRPPARLRLRTAARRPSKSSQRLLPRTSDALLHDTDGE